MRLPVALNAVPEDLRTAVETNQFKTVLKATSVLDENPVRAALHIWALAAQAETGVFIDDVPADAGCAGLYWQVIQSEIPASDENNNFDGDLNRLISQADMLAERLGLSPASGYLSDRPVTSATVARQASKMRGDTAAIIYHLAARLARTEGLDPRGLRARGALGFASAGQWSRCVADLEAIVQDTPFCESPEGNPLAHEAAWALIGAAVTSGNNS